MPERVNVALAQNLEIIDRIRALLDEGEIAPTPSNYEFWYRYVTAADPELVEAIDAVRRTVGKVGVQTMNDIRMELYGGVDHAALGKLIEDTQSQLTRLTGHVDRSESEARSYRGRLDHGTRALQNGETVETQRTIISDMIRATNAMIEKTSILERDLAQSGERISSLKADLEMARVESRTDPLTALPNRKAGSDYLEAHVLRCRSEHRALCVVFMDIDLFKQFNDKFGHRLGDEVLRLVGASCERFFHGMGFVARWGGEEFVVVIPGKRLADAKQIAEDFRAFVAARKVRSKDSQKDVGRITLSLGVAELQPSEGALSIIDRADRALYAAKDAGRNCVMVDEARPKRRAAA